VADSFPNWHQSEKSGFYGDLLLPQSLSGRRHVELSIWDHGPASARCLIAKRFKLGREKNRSLLVRQRDFELLDILHCPKCTGNLHQVDESWQCHHCGFNGPKRGESYFFLDDHSLPFQALTETTHTHPYAVGSHRLLEKVGSGLVLDFGSGNSPASSLRSRTCYLDIQQYAQTDVVSTNDRLPFRDNCFDGVISQSVFEHLADPFLSARELLRVLKPGGYVYVDTAFMQPLHADPSHYFNMTQYGLRQVFGDFEEIQLGIAPHHLPSFGLMMQLDTVLPDMAPGPWRQRLQEVRDLLGKENQVLDHDLGPSGREKLAAGWFFEGRKPQKGHP